MRAFLHDYSLEKACDDVAKLDVHHNAHDAILFCEAAVRYVRCVLRVQRGIELLSYGEKREWVKYGLAILPKHSERDNDLLFIVVTSDMRNATYEMEKAKQSANP